MSRKGKILFLVPHRLGRSPGQRFRFEQYLSKLKEAGFDYTYSNIISKKDDVIFYSKGKYLAKIFIVIKAFFTRLRDIRKLHNYDIALIYREAFMLGTSWFEKKVSRTKTKLIFDFDDSIWLNDVSQGNANLKWVKDPDKTKRICKYADVVFAGNQYLANFALNYNKNVNIVPTTIDTNYHKPCVDKIFDKEQICIGWTGSSTTLKHFETAIPMLKSIKEKYKEKVYFKVIVDFDFEIKELGLKSTKWNKNTEIKDLCEIDIGIMPLPDDKWSKGKCGFKGLQYMALQIPTLMSPVGVNNDIINNGKNGFLCKDLKEWIDKLSILIESPDLRKKIGLAGYNTILNHYSVESQQEKYISYFQELLKD